VQERRDGELSRTRRREGNVGSGRSIRLEGWDGGDDWHRGKAIDEGRYDGSCERRYEY
jgi:hypothetical protein